MGLLTIRNLTVPTLTAQSTAALEGSTEKRDQSLPSPRSRWPSRCPR